MAEKKPPDPTPTYKKTYIICTRCAGQGTYVTPKAQIQCTKCDGTGMIVNEYIEQ